MPRYIIKLEDKYLEWSTVVDAPVTFGMTRNQFAEYYEMEYGKRAFESEFVERMERVDSKGTSSMIHHGVDDLISFNCAGEDGTCLSKEQIVDFFVTKADPSAPKPRGRDLRQEQQKDEA